MSEPVDVVAAGREAIERIICDDALSADDNGRRDSDIVSELCDLVERLQALPEQIKQLAKNWQTTIDHLNELYDKYFNREDGYLADGLSDARDELLALLNPQTGDSNE